MLLAAKSADALKLKGREAFASGRSYCVMRKYASRFFMQKYKLLLRIIITLAGFGFLRC